MVEAIVASGNGDAGKRARRSDVSRQQILDVAAKLFRARGYTETSLRDIGSQVGMKAGSLYYHFTSKEEMAAEVLRIGVRRVHDAVVLAMKSLGPHADIKSRLRAAMTAHLETLLDESDYTSAHIHCFPYAPEGLQRKLRRERQEYDEVWRMLLDDAAAAGALAPGVDRAAARLAILGALNWSLEWYDPKQGLPLHLTSGLLAAFVR